MKPFNLYGAPPVRIELKWAERTSGRPNRFDHFKVASRVRSGPNNNFERIEEVHEIIGDKPRRVPIVLMCDDPMENFSLFRGFWNKSGELGCGTPYGNEVARRFFKVNPDKSVEKIPEGYEVKCSSECKYWKMEKGCTLSGNLFFKLRDLPFSEEFGVVRIKGANAQRRTLSSLSILHQLTGGILANLPLVAVFHQETMKDKNGRSNPIPLISVQHEGSQNDFMGAVAQEWRRRAELYEIRHGRPHGDQEDLLINNVLSSIADREAMVEMGNEESEFFTEEEVGHPLFEGTSIPQRKQETLLYRATKDGEVDEEALQAMIKEENDVGF